MLLCLPWVDPTEVEAMARKPATAASADASAEVFMVAFRSLPQRARRRILSSLLETEELREDVEAVLLWEERKDEPRRSFREYVSEHQGR
jgi:hypothetical protein